MNDLYKYDGIPTIHEPKQMIFTSEYKDECEEISSETDTKKVNKIHHEMMKDLINYTKENELTIRQAQKLFIDCADFILDEKIL